MKKIFSKIKRENDLKFQTETSLFIENNKKWAIKKPLTIEAKKHIKDIYSNYLLLKETLKDVKNVKLVEANLINDGIVFEYTDGVNFDSLMCDAIISKNESLFWQLFQQYLNLIRQLSPITISDFKTVKYGLENVFGVVELNDIECSNIYNIDLIFENIFIDKNNNYLLIDYEWIFKHSLPLNYVVFRAICNMHHKIPKLLNNFITKEKMCEFAGINNFQQEIFWQMEMNFQKYVLGVGAKYFIKRQYRKPVITLEELMTFKDSKKSYINIILICSFRKSANRKISFHNVV